MKLFSKNSYEFSIFLFHGVISNNPFDIRNYNKLKSSILKFSPDFIVHMAAQPLVRQSYDDPRYTYEVNTLGTVNILNILINLRIEILIYKIVNKNMYPILCETSLNKLFN